MKNEMDESTSSLTSRSRRASLHRKTPSLSQHQTTSISKHYQLNHQILAAFESNYEQKIYQVAYALGLQFVETALLEIPKHGYFYSRRHERERMQSALDAVRVSRLLQELQEKDALLGGSNVSRSDGLQVSDRQRVQQLSNLALQQVEQASNDQQQTSYEYQRAETEQELRNLPTAHDQWVVCEPLMAFGDNIKNMVCPEVTTAASEKPPLLMSPVAENGNDEERYFQEKDAARSVQGETERRRRSITKPSRPSITKSGRRSTTSEVPDRGIEHELSLSLADLEGCSPPATSLNRSRSAPVRDIEGMGKSELSLLRDSSTSISDEVLVLPPFLRVDHSAGSEPQTTELARMTSSESQLERALYLSGLEVSPMEDGDDHARTPPPPIKEFSSPSSNASDRLTLATLCEYYREDFFALCSMGRIRISYANTFQGRLPESTNGCTVIAPLLCIHHLLENQIPDPGLFDDTVVQVIDMETPGILSQLRRELGLSEQAFLIPSDAHDYLIENGQLSQHQFVNVIGGNILDESHLASFLSSLSTDKHSKIAATLFFHEHVVAILRVRRENGNFWFDVIDSLPLKKTMIRAEETEEEFIRRLGLLSFPPELQTGDVIPRASRVRCLDLEALTAFVRWYACSKFNDENASYIDQYEWDETSCDFDPRVFQGFVWSESPN